MGLEAKLHNEAGEVAIRLFHNRTPTLGRIQVMPAKKASKTSKRTVIEPNPGDRRYVRRNKEGEFTKQVSVGKSLAADRRTKAKTKVPKGQGDRGDVER